MEKETLNFIKKSYILTQKVCMILLFVEKLMVFLPIELLKSRTEQSMELRGYERVQLETYMFLPGLKKCTLVEYYNEESNQIEYEYWE